MQTIFVSFDSDGQTIVAAFAVQQVPAVSEISSDDPRWKVFYDALPDYAKEGLPSPGT